VKKWESYGLGAFVCFNTNQFTGEEFCKTRDPRVYDPRQLDVAGWVSAFKEAGMKYAVLTTRHTSGFLLWDSATTDFDVASSGNRADVCREFVTECRRQGIAPGFYYCLWGGKDWNPRPDARAVILAQLHELGTQYGEIPYFWMDMKNWAPPDLSTQEIYDELKTLQPRSIVEFNQHVQDGTRISYLPTDVVDGELTLPPSSGHVPVRKVGGTTYYLPFDFNFVSQSRKGGYDYDPLGPSCWFTYGEGKHFVPSHPFPAEAIARQIRLAHKRGGGERTAGDGAGPQRAHASPGRGATSTPWCAAACRRTVTGEADFPGVPCHGVEHLGEPERMGTRQDRGRRPRNTLGCRGGSQSWVVGIRPRSQETVRFRGHRRGLGASSAV
jgi:hypothetical protein